MTAANTTVQVFVNGHQVGSSASTQSDAASSIDLSSLEELIMAMSGWDSDGTGGSAPGTAQVQIWNA